MTLDQFLLEHPRACSAATTWCRALNVTNMSEVWVAALSEDAPAHALYWAWWGLRSANKQACAKIMAELIRVQPLIGRTTLFRIADTVQTRKVMSVLDRIGNDDDVPESEIVAVSSDAYAATSYRTAGSLGFSAAETVRLAAESFVDYTGTVEAEYASVKASHFAVAAVRTAVLAYEQAWPRSTVRGGIVDSAMLWQRQLLLNYNPFKA